MNKPPFISAVILGFLFLIPFIVFEVVNRWQFRESFPLALFIFAWVLQTAFILILAPMIKIMQSGKSVKANPVNFLLRIVGLVMIAYIWGGWIVDQWPCLMGVPNCD